MIYTNEVEDAIKNIVKKCVLQNINSYDVKSDGSIVTNVDKLISKKIYEYYKAMLGDVNFICEEEIIDSIAEDTIVVDPLDGTENFISGLPIYGFSLSHYKNDKHIYSLLYFPSLNLSMSTLHRIERNVINSRIVSLSSYLNLNEIKYAMNNTEHEEYRILGCATYNLYNVILGNFKSYLNPRINSWDILAGINIAVANGRVVLINSKEYHGEYLQHNQKYNLEVR